MSVSTLRQQTPKGSGWEGVRSGTRVNNDPAWTVSDTSALLQHHHPAPITRVLGGQRRTQPEAKYSRRDLTLEQRSMMTRGEGCFEE